MKRFPVTSEYMTSKEKKAKPCVHSREKIEWASKASTLLIQEGTVLWYGSCSCGQRVVEEYNRRGVFTVPKGNEERVFIGE